MASDKNLDFEKKLESVIPLIKKIASNYLSSVVTMEELIQEGTLGVYEAFKRFDPQKEVKFSTYAVFWIKKYILKFIGAGRNNEKFSEAFSYEKKDSGKMNNTESASEENNRIIFPENIPNIEKKVLGLLFNEEKTLKEISVILKISRERVRQIKEKGLRRLRLNSVGKS
ncbi:MAG: sigma-70 family RNA polymerase sigma factor [Candidatus Cloacimonadota bacterium]|nr:sigma-70 family RNA polymerase sigma factor [Candidatus Cloacimonadota bacterium]